jgi:hypothetical protein
MPQPTPPMDAAAFREMCMKANDRSQQAQLMFEMSDDQAGYFIAQRPNKFSLNPVVVFLDATALELACANWLITRNRIQQQLMAAAGQQGKAPDA